MNVAIAITSGALNVGDEVRKVMGRGHRRPPIDSMRATMAMMIAKPRMARGPWKRGGMRRFMWFYGFQWLERGGRLQRDETGVNTRKQKKRVALKVAA